MQTATLPRVTVLSTCPWGEADLLHLHEHINQIKAIDRLRKLKTVRYPASLAHCTGTEIRNYKKNNKNVTKTDNNS